MFLTLGRGRTEDYAAPDSDVWPSKSALMDEAGDGGDVASVAGGVCASPADTAVLLYVGKSGDVSGNSPDVA